MSKHTPGPWIAEARSTLDTFYDVTTLDGSGIAAIWDDSPGIAEANARLIAAAPDMVKALKVAHGAIWSGGNTVKALSAIEAAIAKADGRP